MTPPTRTPAAEPAEKSSRRWTLLERVLAVITALLTVVSAVLGLTTALVTQDKHRAQAEVQKKNGDLTGLQDKFNQLQDQYKQARGENNKLRSQLGLPQQSDGGSPQQQYLSDMDQADYDKKSSTGISHNDADSINQVQYGHSVTMDAGCQNNDGGDFWVDYSISGSWQWFRAAVGVSDSSSTQSTVTVKVLDAVSGREVASNKVSAGAPVQINAKIAGIVRLRLFVNDPNAPKQACGFENIKTTVVWGNARLLKG